MKKFTICLALLAGLILSSNAFAATYTETFLGNGENFELYQGYKATFSFDMTGEGGYAVLSNANNKTVKSTAPKSDTTDFYYGDGIESAVLSFIFASEDKDKERVTIQSGALDGALNLAIKDYNLGIEHNACWDILKWFTTYEKEYARLDIDLTPYSQYLEDGKFTAIVLSLNMGLCAPENDFYVEYASLTINTKDHANQPVPEPATMFLMGTGLAGLAGLRRRRAAKK